MKNYLILFVVGILFTACSTDSDTISPSTTSTSKDVSFGKLSREITTYFPEDSNGTFYNDKFFLSSLVVKNTPENPIANLEVSTYVHFNVPSSGNENQAYNSYNFTFRNNSYPIAKTYIKDQSAPSNVDLDINTIYSSSTPLVVYSPTKHSPTKNSSDYLVYIVLKATYTDGSVISTEKVYFPELKN